MFAGDTRAAKTDVMRRWEILIFHILHCIMNECKHCEYKRVIKSRKCCYFLEINLFYYIIYKSDTCTLHVFRKFPNW
jgi:hypothetical protein